MSSYSTVGTNRLDEAKRFYCSLLPELGIEFWFDHPRGGVLFAEGGKIRFAVFAPYDGKPATVGNGTMVGFEAPKRTVVDSMHARALALGAKDEGAPGVRGPDPHGPFYGAYFRDLDGNKICVYHWQPR